MRRIVREWYFNCARADSSLDRFDGGAIDGIATHGRSRRAIAATDARCGNDAYARSETSLQIPQQLAAPCHGARQRLAHAHGDRGWRDLTLFHDVEVVIEGGDLVHLGHR